MDESIGSLLDCEEPIFRVCEQHPRLLAEVEGAVKKRWQKRVKIWNDYGFEVLDATGGGHLARFFFARSCKGLIRAVTVLLVAGLVPIAITVITGDFVNNNLKLDASSDLGWYLHIIASLILVIAVGLYFRELPRVLINLCLGGVFRVTQHQFNDFVQKGNKTYASRIVTFAPWALATVAYVAGLSTFHVGDSNAWHSLNTTLQAGITCWVSMPMVFCTYYIVASAVLRIAATFVVLNRFFRFDACVQPFHPDGCGGLYPLGRLSMRLNIIVFGFGAICAFGIFVNLKDYEYSLFHLMNVILVISYVVGSVVIFFLPLYAAHARMRDARASSIQAINNRFQRLNEQIIEAMRHDKSPAREKFEEIEGIRKMYEIAKSMPVYPFNMAIVSSFVGSLGIPIVVCVLQVVLAKVL